MYELQQHEMRLMTTYPSGAEMWHCPICGRLFLTHWPPSCSSIVLVPGDDQAVHLGGPNDLGIELPGMASFAEAEDMAAQKPSIAADEPPETGPTTADEFLDADGLRPWLKWLKDAGLAE